MDQKRYPSDLTDSQWEHLEPLLPRASAQGRRRTVDLREVVNGILYVLHGGIPWRMAPHDLPPWGTVWWYFRNGGPMALGSGLKRRCAARSERGKEGMPPLAPPSSTASR